MQPYNWKKDPALQGLPPEKLDFLTQILTKAEACNKDTLAPFLMQAMAQAKEKKMTVSDGEFALILKVLTENMSPEEKKRSNMIIQMTKMLSKKHPPTKVR